MRALPDSFRQQSVNAILVLLGLLLLASVWGAILRVRESVDTGRQDIMKSARRLVDHLDHEVDIHVYNVMAMKLLADRFLDGEVIGADNPVRGLRPVPARTGYASDVPADPEAAATVGRLVGSGPLPPAKGPVASEMAMAVGLTPLMRAIRARSPDTPWVYYTSVKEFMFLFPAQDARDFYFHPSLARMEFFAMGTPGADPERKAYWSHPYLDAAGKGLIVTVSQPIYRGDDFLGCVSIDLSVRSLQSLLDTYPFPGAATRLISDNGQQLAARSVMEASGARSGEDMLSLRLREAPWRLELEVDRQRLLRAALSGRAAHILTVGVLGISYLFLLLLVRNNRRIRELSIRDDLTGLYNRRHFEHVTPPQVEAAGRGTYQLGLAVADVDHFKKFNDAYGHQQGDVALRAVAQALRGALRRGSDQVFRVGGEEFAVVVPLAQNDSFESVLGKLTQAVRDIAIPHRDSPPGKVTISVGATVIDHTPEVTLDRAFFRADEALYRAKSAGRDRYVLLEQAQAGHSPAEQAQAELGQAEPGQAES